MLTGLTGNFGTGKSTVLAIFSNLGAFTTSADEIVHKLFKRSDVQNQIRELMGDVFDSQNNPDRKRIANLIFNNVSLKESLESILHPLVLQSILETSGGGENTIVLAEIPLLFEAGYERYMDKVITVTSTKEAIIKRLTAKGFSGAEIEQRLSHQMPDKEKFAHSDFVIDNSGDIAITTQACNSIFKILESGL